MPPDKRRAPPAGYGDAPLENIAAVNSDEPDSILDIPVSQLRPRPVRPDEIPELRAVWWRLAAQGIRMPAEPGVIVIDIEHPTKQKEAPNA